MPPNHTKVCSAGEAKPRDCLIRNSISYAEDHGGAGHEMSFESGRNCRVTEKDKGKWACRKGRQGGGAVVAVHAYVLVTDIAERRQLDMQGERGDFPCPVCYSKHTSGYLS